MIFNFLLEGTNWFWAALAALAAAGAAWTFARAGASVLEPSSAVLFVKSGGGVYLDVRAAADFARGHIAGAKNLPAAEMDGKSAEVEKYKDKPVLLVCANGVQSRATAKQLTARGFSNIRVMAGGMAAWAEAQLPMQGKRKG